MKKMTQAEFDALERNEDGHIVIPAFTDLTEVSKFGDWCKFGHDCEFADNCEFGDWCNFGNRCNFGDYCEFGYRCNFGDYCEFGYGCTFGGGCEFGYGCEFGGGCEFGESTRYNLLSFERGRVENGCHLTVGNIGRAARTAYFYIDENGALFVRAGCWFSDAEAFKDRVQSVHGESLHSISYLAALDYAAKVLPVMLKDRQEKAKER